VLKNDQQTKMSGKHQSHHEMLESLERELVSPSTRKDSTRINELLADEFTEYGSSGKVFRKSDILSSVETAADYALSNFTFSDLAAGITLVKYKSIVSGQAALRSSIWVQNKGAWQLFHHQATVVPNAT
jgi:hypothetical protein